MECAECGRDFTVDADEPFGDERDICYPCERSLVAEIAPELLSKPTVEEVPDDV